MDLGPRVFTRAAERIATGRTAPPVLAQHVAGNPVQPRPGVRPVLVVVLRGRVGAEPDLAEQVIGNVPVGPRRASYRSNAATRVSRTQDSSWS
jgi:hypothetical protein